MKIRNNTACLLQGSTASLDRSIGNSDGKSLSPQCYRADTYRHNLQGLRQSAAYAVDAATSTERCCKLQYSLQSRHGQSIYRQGIIQLTSMKKLLNTWHSNCTKHTKNKGDVSKNNNRASIDR